MGKRERANASVSSARDRMSLETPSLYRVVSVIESGGKATDHDDVAFGIRSIRFDPDHGFFLNGKPVKLKGTCNHQDHAGVGIAVPGGSLGPGRSDEADGVECLADCTQSGRDRVPGCLRSSGNDGDG